MSGGFSAVTSLLKRPLDRGAAACLYSLTKALIADIDEARRTLGAA
jgi:hypothetical protein